MSFLLRCGLAIALVYAWSPLRDGRAEAELMASPALRQAQETGEALAKAQRGDLDIQAMARLAAAASAAKDLLAR